LLTKAPCLLSRPEPLTVPSSTTCASGTMARVAAGRPAMNRYVSAKALALNEVSRWSMPAMTTFSAPFSAGPSKPTFVAVPLRPIQAPSGWANLSLLSERMVSQRTPGVTSLPSAPCGALSPRRNGPAPLNSLFGANAGSFQTPWLGTPPSTACETVPAPPPCRR